MVVAKQPAGLPGHAVTERRKQRRRDVRGQPASADVDPRTLAQRQPFNWPVKQEIHRGQAREIFDSPGRRSALSGVSQQKGGESLGMEENVHLGKVAGIKIGANWSLLLIFWLIVWSLASGQLPHSAPGYSTAAYYTAALLAGALFYVCLLAHELAHALVARH